MTTLHFDLDAASSRLRVGPHFQLSHIGSGETPGAPKRADKAAGEALFAERAREIDVLQEQLFAARSGATPAPSVLFVLQGMDASGKGGIIRHVFGAFDPQGLHIASFKKPTAEELAHDFLWRIAPKVPEPGMIGIFDRSHYEDVLVQRVRKMAPAEEIERRYGAINEFEHGLVEGGTRVVKLMLHVGRDAQAERLLERIERDDKHWKYNPGDIDERMLWPEYQEAYQVALERTSTPDAPWFVVPSDHKWYARLLVAELLAKTLRDLHLGWPPAQFDPAVERERLAAS